MMRPMVAHWRQEMRATIMGLLLSALFFASSAFAYDPYDRKNCKESLRR